MGVQIAHALDLDHIQGAAAEEPLGLPHLLDAGLLPVRSKAFLAQAAASAQTSRGGGPARPLAPTAA